MMYSNTILKLANMGYLHAQDAEGNEIASFGLPDLGKQIRESELHQEEADLLDKIEGLKKQLKDLEKGDREGDRQDLEGKLHDLLELLNKLRKEKRKLN